MAYKNDCSCLENAAEDEPIFVLRGQDASAPETILHWIILNLGTCPEEKLREAFEHALIMKKYPVKKNAD